MKGNILHFPLGQAQISKTLYYMTATHYAPAQLLSWELSQVQQLFCKSDAVPSDPGSSNISMREVRKNLVENKHILPPFLLFTVSRYNKTIHTNSSYRYTFLTNLHGNIWYTESFFLNYLSLHSTCTNAHAHHV